MSQLLRVHLLNETLLDLNQERCQELSTCEWILVYLMQEVIIRLQIKLAAILARHCVAEALTFREARLNF